MKRRAKNITSSLVVASVLVFLFAGTVSAEIYNHVSIDVSSIPDGSLIELEMQLWDINWNIGDTWALIDNVNLGPGDEVVNFEDGTLQGFDESLNPGSVDSVLGSLSGGSYLMRIDEDPGVWPTLTWRHFLPLSATATTLSFDFKVVTTSAADPGWDDFLVVSIRDTAGNPFPGIPDLTGIGDIIEASAFGVTSTSVADVTVVPAPGAFLLGSIGLAFANWKLRKREKL